MVGLQSVGTIKMIFIEQSHAPDGSTIGSSNRRDHDILSANAFVEIDHFGRLRPRNRVRAPVESRRSAIGSVGRSVAGEGGDAPLKQLRGFKSSCRPGSSFLTRIPPYL